MSSLSGFEPIIEEFVSGISGIAATMQSLAKKPVPELFGKLQIAEQGTRTTSLSGKLVAPKLSA